MNCLAFRRQHEIDPRSTDEALATHKLNCEACATFSARGAKFEQRLAATLKVPVAENLASRILLNHSFEPTGSRRLMRWIAMRLAASVMLAVALTVIVTERAPTLDQAVVSLNNEAQHALIPTAPVGLPQIRESLMPVGVELERETGVVTFASPCLIRGQLAGHIVLRGGKSHISVLLMPNESLPAQLAVNESGSVGIVVPDGRGSIAIIGAPGECLDALASALCRSLRWSA